jgi:hypothetical protein
MGNCRVGGKDRELRDIHGIDGEKNTRRKPTRILIDENET